MVAPNQEPMPGAETPARFRGRRPVAIMAIALLIIACALPLAAYWPGIMTWDATREYGMALRDPIDDWHPPVMIWVWRQLHRLAVGPAPMLLLQVGLYVAGWALLVRGAWASERPRRALAFAACALFPIALAIEGCVLKDCLMAGALLVALALIAPAQPKVATRVVACLLMLFAATLRYNALFACLPLFVTALPEQWRNTRARLPSAVLAATLALAAVTPAANRMIGAQPSGVELSQVLFDLGGITKFSGTDAFPPIDGVADLVAVNRSCYHPELWDSYAWWTDHPCPIGWANVGPWFAARHNSSLAWWIEAIARHPLAYAEHRVSHFAVNVRIVAPRSAASVIPPRPDRNPYGFDVSPNRISIALDSLAAAIARTPLGLPIVWIAVAAAVLMLFRKHRSRLAMLAASSSLMFGLSYLVLSVASDLRYHLWTAIGALVALAASASPEVRRSDFEPVVVARDERV
jgi:hypothetical protein